MAKNQYDPSLDKIVKVYMQKEISDKRGVRVVARQYNGGAIKIATEEVFERRGEPMSTPMKRIPLELLLDVSKAYVVAAADSTLEQLSAPKSEPRPAEKPQAPKRSIWSAG